MTCESREVMIPKGILRIEKSLLGGIRSQDLRGGILRRDCEIVSLGM